MDNMKSVSICRITLHEIPFFSARSYLTKSIIWIFDLFIEFFLALDREQACQKNWMGWEIYKNALNCFTCMWISKKTLPDCLNLLQAHFWEDFAALSGKTQIVALNFMKILSSSNMKSNYHSKALLKVNIRHLNEYIGIRPRSWDICNFLCRKCGLERVKIQFYTKLVKNLDIST